MPNAMEASDRCPKVKEPSRESHLQTSCRNHPGGLNQSPRGRQGATVFVVDQDLLPPPPSYMLA